MDTTKVATDVVAGLRGHPLALALIVVNVLFIVSAAWTLRSIAQASERRDALISQMAKDCLVAPKVQP